jgi:hypothetical protein
MYKQLTTATCAIDWLLALLFTQAGTFFVGKTHADSIHGVAPHELAFGMSTGDLAGLALILAVSLVLHGLWCWRRFKTLGPQHEPKPLEIALTVAAPLIGVIIGITLATALV